MEELDALLSYMYIDLSVCNANTNVLSLSTSSYARKAQDIKLCFELITHRVGRASKIIPFPTSDISSFQCCINQLWLDHQLEHVWVRQQRR